MTINFIGAGKLGKTLAKLIYLNKAGSIQGICNSSFESAVSAVDFIGAGTAYHSISDLPTADLTFITTPDALIKSTCDSLTNSKQLKPASLIIHCSGSLSSEILAAVKSNGCNIASVHPMRSFAEAEISIGEYHGTFCAFEGDAAAFQIISDLFTKIGSFVYSIESNKKDLYHAAGVFASNYLLSLFQKSLYCLKQAGVDNNIAIDIIQNLMQGTLNNLQNTRSSKQALTGPIKRGDISTIAKHLTALADPALIELYKQLGLATLEIAALPKETEQEIRKIFKIQTLADKDRLTRLGTCLTPIRPNN